MITTFKNSVKNYSANIVATILLLVVVGTSTVHAQSCALLCPTVPVATSTSSQCGVTLSNLQATTTGDCMSVPPAQSGFFEVGETTITFSTTDGAGTPVSCTTVVVVLDNTAPEIEGCDNVTVNVAAGDCGTIFELPFTDVTDNCGSAEARFSQSEDETTAEQGFVCQNGSASYWRVYNTDDYNIYTGLEINSVDFLVFEAFNNPEVTVNIYTVENGTITTGTLTLVSEATQLISNISNVMASIPITAIFEPNTTFAVEIIVPGSTFNGALMAFNDGAHSSPTYVTSGFCGVNDPTTVDALGFTGFGAVMIVNGIEPATALVQVDNTGFEPGDELDAGTYQFGFRAIDASGNLSDVCNFTYEVNPFDGAISAIACNDEVQISLDGDCIAVVGADQILEGGPYGCFDDYQVEITDENGVNYGNTLTTDNIGQTLKARVTSPSGNSCWSNVVIEDKAPAPLECEPVYTTCSGDLEPGSPVPSNVTYSAVLNPITEDLPAAGTTTRNIPVEVFGLGDATVTNVAVRFDISHEAISDLTASITSPDGVTRALFLQPGTNCQEDNLKIMISPQATLTSADLSATCVVGEDYAASGMFQPADDLSVFDGSTTEGEWIITISDIVDGNGGTVNSVELILGQSGAEVTFPTTLDITYIPIDEYSYRIEGLDACGPVTVAYIDSLVEQPCESPFDKVIIRKWSATDAQGNESETCSQTITVFRNGLESVIFPPNYDDIEEPSLSCDLYADEVPGIDVTGGISGELCDIIQVFPPDDTRLEICEGSYKIIRKFKVLQWCSGEVLEHTQIIKVLDKEGPELEPIPDMTISASDFSCVADYTVPKPVVLYDCSDEFTYELAYLPATNAGPAPTDEVYLMDNISPAGGGDFKISDLGFGNTWVRWRVQDECGNDSFEYFTISVTDQIAPVAVCDEFTVVSVGGDGRILVDAESFDDGSYDNCGIRDFKAAKMVDICNSGSTQFRDEVEFCCDEIGTTIMVQFRVTDNFGNSNTCMVEVQVQDKLPPYITFCPEDVTLDCQADYEDLTLTGEAEAIDNCELESLLYSDNGAIDNCGEGTITRTWTATDANGLKHSCTQVITLINDDPFIRNDIDWPEDYTTETCMGDLNPENLPAANAYPRYDEGVCSLVATHYKDQTFIFVDGACEKILRTWTVIDWCTYDDLNPVEGEGIYTYVQVIKLKNTEGPEILNCENATVNSFGACEGQVDFTLVATDDCTEDTELDYEYEINLFDDNVPDPLFTGNSATISRILPDGRHEVTWKVFDKCGNKTTCKMFITVVDGKKPTPYCRGTIVTAVMNSNGEVAIWAKDFDLGSFDNCTPQADLKFSFSTNVADSSQVFSCADIPDGVQALVPLKMWVTDLEGNQDFCDVTVHVQDNEANFCEEEDGSSLTIGGTVETQYSKPVGGVEVTVTRLFSPEPVKQVFTNQSGRYSANGLPKNNSYNVSAYKNDDTRAGVNTLDLVKIQRHILGLEVLTNPYDIIAADITNDEKLKPSDLLALRKVILGINSEFPNGQTSWRFLPSNYEFANSNDPFPYVDVMSMENMQHSANYENMVAVKIGDIDNSVNPLREAGDDIDSRSSEALTLEVDNAKLQEGEQVEIPVYANQAGLYAYQFTLNTEGLIFTDVKAGQLNVTEDNFGIFEDMITTAWDSPAGSDVYADEPLFTLVFTAEQNTSVEKALSISSDITEALAFDINGNTMDVEIEVRSENVEYDEFKLFQNKPNPFTSSTNISFYLPSSQDVKLNIYDATGKIIFSKSAYFTAGVQAFDIQNEQLSTAGILYYEVSAGPHKSTMKMVSIK